jgi:hypothetical protein
VCALERDFRDSATILLENMGLARLVVVEPLVQYIQVNGPCRCTLRKKIVWAKIECYLDISYSKKCTHGNSLT